MAIAAAGCAPAETPKKPAGTAAVAPKPASPSETKATPATPAEAVDARIGSWDDVQKLVAGHAGKVVVVDVWSLNCQPCIREFPGLVKLSESQAGKVACISFDIDYDGSSAGPPESYRADVLKFLKERNAKLTNVISNVPNEDFLNAIKLGGPPAVFVYDKTGKLARRFDNSVPKQPEFTYEKDVIPFVEKLLAGS